jgi:hypothetical protein
MVMLASAACTGGSFRGGDASSLIVSFTVFNPSVFSDRFATT